MSKDSPGTERLEVGTVRTVGKAGLIETRSWVLCPRFGASVSLSRCLSCEHRETLRMTRDGAEVLCHPTLERGHATPGLPAPLGAVHVSELMTRDMVCVAEDLSLEEAAHLLASRASQSAPVLNHEARVVGMISERSIQRYLANAGGSDSSSIGQTGADPVSCAMTRSLVVIAESASATRAAAVMAHEGVDQLLVSSAQGQLVGMIHARALLRWIAQADGFLLAPERSGAPEPAP